MSHINLNELDVTQVKLAKKGRAIRLMYNKEPLQLVTGLLYTPFGVRVTPNSYSDYATCTLDCSLNQSKSEVSVKYSDSLVKLDAKVIELIEQSENLFNVGNDNVDFADIKSCYSPILRDNKTYPKLIKIALPRDSNGNFDFVIFNEKKEKVPLDDDNIIEVLSKGNIFKAIIECGKVWYYKGKFGITWNLKQLKFVENTIETKPTNIASNSEMYETVMLLDD